MGDDNKEIKIINNHSTENLKPFTRESGASANRRRWELAREAGAEGLKRAVDESLATGGKIPRGGLPHDAWGVIVEHIAEVMLASQSLRGVAEAANFIGKSTGMLAPESKEAPQSAEGALLGLEDAKIIFNVYNYHQNEYRQPDGELDVIEAELHDLSDDPKPTESG